MKCIVHVPNKLDKTRLSGSQLRPFYILEAFRELGYEVDFVEGNGEERKRKISEILEKIENGAVYDFCYSESSTMPTELTESHHLPTTFNLDFGFFKKLKEKNIPIGLFYRDCHWMFDVYKETVSLPKRIFAEHFYKRDLKKYGEFVDLLYLPSDEMGKVLPSFLPKMKTLPPAIDEIVETPFEEKEKIQLFYVGGISGVYNMKKLFQIVHELDFLELTVCTRKGEWESENVHYEKYLNNRIKIIHGGPKDYEAYIKKADLCSLLMEPTEYLEFAMPIKVFEYLKYEKPIIGTAFPATEEIISKTGFAVNYELVEIKNVFIEIFENRKILKEKKEAAVKLAKENLWKNRAEQVVEDLKR